MRIPTIFVPDKNQDEKLKDILQEVKKARKTKGITSFACLPENIGDYALKGEFASISKKRWDWNFGEHIPKYLSKAAGMAYMAPLASIFTSVYILEFKSEKDLNKLNRKTNLEKEINQIDAMKTRCLKKDNYLVAIKTNKIDKDSLDVIGDFYLKNFEMERL